VDLVHAVHAPGAAYGQRDGLAAEWRAEHQLAVVVAALTLAGRSLLGEDGRQWCLSVAARAAAAFRHSLEGERRVPAAAQAPVATPTVRAALTRAKVVGLPERPPRAVDRAVPPVLVALRAAPDHSSIVVLHGLPGAGKTQLAGQYAHEHKDDYTGVVWLPASAPELLAEQLAHVATQLGLPPVKDLDLLRRTVFEHLSATGPWLYVLDDALDARSCRPFVPVAAGVNVLITSRDPRWTQLGVRWAVGPFEPEESLALLTSILGDRPHLAELAGALDHLPAAVDQAAHFLADSTIGVADYVDLVRAEPVRVLTVGDTGVPGLLGTTWRLALERHAAQDPVAADLVEFASFLGAAPIPRTLLAAVPASAYPRLAAETSDALGLDAVVKRAAATGLIHVEDGAARLYPLFQTFARNHTTPADRARAEQATRVAVARCGGGDPVDPRAWPDFHRLLPHALAVDLAGGDADARRLLLDVVRYLIARHDLDTALDTARAARQRWSAAFGEHAEPTLQAMTHMAQAHYHRGEHEEALRLDVEVLIASRRSFGERASATLVAARNAAASRAAVGTGPMPELPAGAELPTSVELLALHRDVLGPDHPDTLRAAHNHAADLRESGRFADAAVVDADTRARMIAVLGEHHLETLRSGHALGLDLRLSGDHVAALELTREVHAVRRQVLGDRHPATAQSATSLAEDLRRAGQPEAASRLLRVAHPVLAETYGVDDPLTLLAAHELCTALAKLGDVEPDEVEDVLVRRRRVLGDSDLHTLRTWSLWIDALVARGDTLRAADERTRWRARMKEYGRSRATGR
jgi:hypothetical protein